MAAAPLPTHLLTARHSAHNISMLQAQGRGCCRCNTSHVKCFCSDTLLLSWHLCCWCTPCQACRAGMADGMSPPACTLHFMHASMPCHSGCDTGTRCLAPWLSGCPQVMPMQGGRGSPLQTSTNCTALHSGRELPRPHKAVSAAADGHRRAQQAWVAHMTRVL
jgi:hypothetical protein